MNPAIVEVRFQQTTSLVIILIYTLIFFSCDQQPSNNLLYIDKEKPDNVPRLFAKDFITKDSVSEYGSVFNSAGTEFFFAIDSAGKSLIKHSNLIDNKWTEPEAILPNATYSHNDPFLSPDESKLYFISDKPNSISDTIEDIDIWYSERLGTDWSEPINAGNKINSEKNEYYISFTSNGSMYFSSNKESEENRKHDFDIYKSNFIDGQFQIPEKVNDSINTRRYEADVFISPDESYIIFCSARRSGLGRGDLYISFKDDNEEWTSSVNMGKTINSEGHEICPFVTRDGQYFFYTSNQDIYWVSTNIIDSIRNTSLGNLK